MDNKKPVLVIGPEGELSQKLLALCQSTGHDAWHYDCAPLQAWKQAPSILICADSSLEIQSKRSGVALIAPEVLTVDVYQKGIELGVEEVHSFESSIDEIAAFLNREHFYDKEGKVVLLQGTSGGVGTSSLSVCLAKEYKKKGLKCLLVDLHQYQKGLSAFIEKGLDWSDFESVQGNFSQHHFESLPTLADIPCLSWTSAESRENHLSSEVLEIVLGTAQSAFDIIIVDGSAEHSEHLADASGIAMMRATSEEATIAKALGNRFEDFHCVVQGKLPLGVDEKIIKATAGVSEIHRLKKQKTLEHSAPCEPEVFLKNLSKSDFPQLAQELMEQL